MNDRTVKPEPPKGGSIPLLQCSIVEEPLRCSAEYIDVADANCTVLSHHLFLDAIHKNAQQG